MVRSKMSSEKLQSFLAITNRYEVITGWRKCTYKENVNENIKQNSLKIFPNSFYQSRRHYFFKKQKPKTEEEKYPRKMGNLDKYEQDREKK